LQFAACTKPKEGFTAADNALAQPDSVKLAQAYIAKAEALYDKKVFDSAFLYYNKSKNLFSVAKDSLWVAYPLIKMARIQKIFGDYFESEATAIEAVEYLKHTDYANYKCEAYNILGISYRKRSIFNKALYYYDQADKYTKDSLPKCIVKYNKALVYTDKKDYPRALKMLNDLMLSDTIQHRSNILFKSHLLKTYGDIYADMKDPKALFYMNEAYGIRRASNDSLELCSSYLQFATYYKGKDSRKQKEYATKVFAIAKQVNSVDDKLAALQLLISANSGNAMKEPASLYVKIRDSIDKVRLRAKNEFTAIKYDSKELDDKLKRQQLQNKLQEQKHNTEEIVFILVAIFIVIIAVLIYFIQKLKHKKARIQEVYSTESRISKKIHDELANDIFNVISFTENKDIANPAMREKLLQSLDSVYSKTRDISRENNAIETGGDYPEALKEMLAEYNTQTTTVIIVNLEGINWQPVNSQKKIALYRVLQELMVNMKKHSGATTVVMRFTKDDTMLIVHYNDNGSGFTNKQLVLGNGLKNTQNRISAVGGTIDFTSPAKGLKVAIELPV